MTEKTTAETKVLTEDQRQLARHALGLPNKNNISYRNRYICDARNADWQSMVAAGMALIEQITITEDGATAHFTLTYAGAVTVLAGRERLCPEDFPEQWP